MFDPRYTIFEQTLVAIKKDIPKFKFIQKRHSWRAKILSKVVFWIDYMKAWTASYPNVYAPDIPHDKQVNPSALQHEFVHLKDQETFFGLLSFLPAWFNHFLFNLVYGSPQILALVAFGAFWNLWWLLGLLFLLPFPSPLRAFAELRGYRRSREFGMPIDIIVQKFIGKKYYFMFPFKNYVVKALEKDSPYKEMMDEARRIRELSEAKKP